ncbi:MAG: hypothetical protein ACD_61C00259G0001 [uncultured bacterium]|nr:MAG: hypothetical protein ACD_61C00259G0001 [uncultured bacterium]
MLNDKWLGLFFALGLFALALTIPGVAGFIATAVTTFPNFWGFATAAVMSLAFGVRYQILRRRRKAL